MVSSRQVANQARPWISEDSVIDYDGQVFGYVDPATPIGYNIAPGVQQLISSLMTLGAFLGSFIAGT